MSQKQTSTDIDELIEQILVDARGDDEGMAAFYEGFAAMSDFPRTPSLPVNHFRSATWTTTRTFFAASSQPV